MYAELLCLPINFDSVLAGLQIEVRLTSKVSNNKRTRRSRKQAGRRARINICFFIFSAARALKSERHFYPSKCNHPTQPLFNCNAINISFETLPKNL